MARLSVNLNKVALLRNTRHTGVPDILTFARLALENGAKGITVHPRPDERHIRGSDVPMISKWMKPVRPGIEFNIEGYPDERFLKIVSKAKPEQCTLVPDDPMVFTSEEGWDLSKKQLDVLLPAIVSLKKIGGRIILFVDPDCSATDKVQAIGANGIEIYTGSYAAAFRSGEYQKELEKIAKTAEHAHSLGLVVNVGHDLNLHNLPPLIARLPFIAEASIGHELTADALAVGFPTTVRSYVSALSVPGEPQHVEYLSETSVDKNPFKQFNRWYRDAEKLPKHNAVVLATSSKKGSPSARVVLLKEHDAQGFVFYTNYQSRKSRELSENPVAALVFHWSEFERQVRIAGKVSEVSKKQSLEYFHTRSRESQIGAWASMQSNVIPSRTAFEEKVNELQEKYKGKEIPLPPFWGGFRLTPQEFEFWHQGHPGRLHDRIWYKKTGVSWNIQRLSP